MNGSCEEALFALALSKPAAKRAAWARTKAKQNMAAQAA
jgi:hypothetical protein